MNSNKDKQDKLPKKRFQLIERTAKILDISIYESEQLLSIDRRQSIRVNPLVKKKGELNLGLKIEWANHCFEMPQGANVLDYYAAAEAGEIYIQNASSWLPVIALDVKPGEKVLDVCAAPGGKTTHIAAVTDNQSLITANDSSKPRLHKLRQNCERMQAEVERYTLHDGRKIASKIGDSRFDKILLDAPCSGEGLIDINKDLALKYWSLAQIKRLQSLQKQLLTRAWQLLKPGGTLVYSTCTIAAEENEAVVSYALQKLEGCTIVPIDIEVPDRYRPVMSWNGIVYDPRVEHALRIKPTRLMEAFFVSKLQKSVDVISDETDYSYRGA